MKRAAEVHERVKPHMHKIQQTGFNLQAVLGLRLDDSAPYAPLPPVTPDLGALSVEDIVDRPGRDLSQNSPAAATFMIQDRVKEQLVRLLQKRILAHEGNQMASATRVATNRESLKSQHDAASPNAPLQQPSTSASPRLLPSEEWDPKYWPSLDVDPDIGVISPPTPVAAMWWTPGFAHDFASWHKLLSSQPQPPQQPFIRSTPLQRVIGASTAAGVPQVLLDIDLTRLTTMTLYDITIPANFNHDPRFSAGRWLFILMVQQPRSNRSAVPLPGTSIPADANTSVPTGQAPAQAAGNGPQHGPPPLSAGRAPKHPAPSAQPRRTHKRRKAHHDMPAPPPPHAQRPHQPASRPIPTDPNTPWQLLALPFNAVTSHASYTLTIPAPMPHPEFSASNAHGGQRVPGKARRLVQTELRLGGAGSLPLVDGHEARVWFWEGFCRAMGRGEGALVVWSEAGVEGLG